MANDKRKTTAHGRKVSLVNQARGTRKKKRAPVGKIILAVLGVGVVIAGIFLGVAAWKLVKSYLGGSGGDANPPAPYEADRQVAYYLFGLFGEDDAADMSMLSLVCYDKKEKTVNVLQIPASTYLGDMEKWDVPTVGGVWAHPKPLDWCTTCRRQVYQSEIEDGRHNANTQDGAYCGTLITKQAGSAVANLLEVFNHQYTLTIDNYYLMPQEAFVKLVDLVDGIDVELTSDQTLGEVDYPAGIRTLDGAAALQYILGDEDSVKDQVDNLLSQRQVYAALFERLFSLPRTKLDDDVLWPLMKGSTPIRTRRDNEIADDITLMIDLVQDLGTVPREQIAVYLLPGEAATADGVAYYSVHKDELATLLNDAFVSGLAIAPEHLKMTELADTGDADLHRQTMAELLVQQSGQLPEDSEEDE